MHATAARALTRDTLSFDAAFLENPANIRINFRLPETRVPKLYDSCYSSGLSVFIFT